MYISFYLDGYSFIHEAASQIQLISATAHAGSVKNYLMQSATQTVVPHKNFACMQFGDNPFINIHNKSAMGLIDFVWPSPKSKGAWGYGGNSYIRQAYSSKVNPTMHHKDIIGVSSTGSISGGSYGPGLDVVGINSKYQSYTTPYIVGKIARMMYYHPEWNFSDCRQRLRYAAS